MNRVVLCGGTFAAFGPMNIEDVLKFIKAHEKVCKRSHTLVKLTDPKFGVNDA